MSKVINPTDSAIEIQFRGVQYRVEANGALENVPAPAAEYWKSMIHNFIQIVDEDAKAAPKMEEPEVIEVPEDAIVSREEVVAELGEEAVAAIEAGAEVVEADVVITPSPKKGKK